MVSDPTPAGGAPTVEDLCANLEPRLAQLPGYSQRLSATRTADSPGHNGPTTAVSAFVTTSPT
jgi:hypothetical protein